MLQLLGTVTISPTGALLWTPLGAFVPQIPYLLSTPATVIQHWLNDIANYSRSSKMVLFDRTYITLLPVSCLKKQYHYLAPFLRYYNFYRIRDCDIEKF